MARLTDGDDMLTFWSRAQYMRREVEPDVTELQAHTSQLYPPSFWLTKKQAQRRWASSMTSADRAAYEKRRNSHRQFVSPMRRRGEAVMNSPNKPTSILSRSHTPKTPAKAKTNREKKAEMRAEFRQRIKDRGSWKYVTQAGCSFYYNETTGMCETEPPDYVRKRGMVRAVEAANFLGRNIAAERKAAPEADDWIKQMIADEEASRAEEDSLAEDSFSFLDEWSREGPTRFKW